MLPWLKNIAKKAASKPDRRGRANNRLKRQAKTYLRVEQLEVRNMLSASGLENSAIEGLKNNIDHIIVIYQENWSFDGLYGSFPGANGIADASKKSLNQIDRITGTPLNGAGTFNPAYVYDPATLQNPPPPLTSSNKIDTRFLTDPNNPNSPTAINTLLPYDASQFLTTADKTGDLVHRFWQEQSQINDGKMNQFITWSDNPGLVMSHFDATNLPEGLLAQQYTIADNFFHAAFGGSFLNHQFLVAAAAPVYPNAPSSLMPVLDATGQQLALDPVTGKIISDGKITPINSVYDQNYAINTIFSANLAPAGFNPTSTGLLPSQNDSNPTDPNRPYIENIGDLLDNAGVGWKWYSGGWDAALASSPTNPANNGKTPANPPVDPNFQWHHQPFAYYDNFALWIKDPTTGQMVSNPLSAAHLQDENNLFSDLANNTLPAVSFIKQVGENNEHPGYADLLQGQQATAAIVHAVQNSADWAHTAIVITYDENGGRFDHVSAPDRLGIWGDGSRVPAIIISPFAKKGFVDHKQLDTLSILKTIEERFSLNSLNGRDAGARDLLSAFSFPSEHEGSRADQLAAAQKDFQNDLTELGDLARQLAADLTRVQNMETRMDTLQQQLATDLGNHDANAVAADRKTIGAEKVLLHHAEQDVRNDNKEIRGLWRDLGEDLREIQELDNSGGEH
jgi:acid phosphatase